jgi:cytochrome c biogenesis protein CcmG/thiol:disulfide interchange protein DsbE
MWSNSPTVYRARGNGVRRLAFVIAVTLLACGSAPLANAAPSTIAAGAKFPDLVGAGLEGKLPDLAAAKVVIIDFWASWCGPCKQSFPVYSELHREFGPKGVVIIAVNVDRSAADMQKFLSRLQPDFAVVRDAQQQLVAKVAVPTMPTAFVLDRHGVVRFVHSGFHGENSRLEYINQINALLSESP